jgi:tetratricopeptide (TPR) repeat protein
METCLQLGRQIDRITLSMQQAIRLGPEEEAYLERLQTLSDRIARVVEIFQVISLNHISEGAELATKLIEKFPDSYLGYRVAADHKRLIRDWDGFDLMVKKVESINPDSNGLVFLKGAAALQRDADHETAIEHYERALAKDPDFVRAQSHLVMAQTDLDGLVREYEKLEQLNPNHQMVQWMDAAIEITERRGR